MKNLVEITLNDGQLQALIDGVTLRGTELKVKLQSNRFSGEVAIDMTGTIDGKLDLPVRNGHLSGNVDGWSTEKGERGSRKDRVDSRHAFTWLDR